MTTKRTPNENDDFSTGRVLRITAILVAVGAVAELVLFRTWMGAMSLTAAGLVAMINFRWLEVIVNRTVQPGKTRVDRWTVLRIFGRLTLLAGVFAALLMVPQVDPVAVTLGFSALVVAIVIEGLRQVRIEGG
jgi:hypothetical protein